MEKGNLFWVIWVLLLIFGVVVYWPAGGGHYWIVGWPIAIMVLFGLLGWQVFGKVVK